jgi:hypothetical protein
MLSDLENESGGVSVRLQADYNIEALSLRERTESAVPREKRNPAVDAALGDQCISKVRFAALRHHPGLVMRPARCQ